uniref:Uncharacterized protein n=1 Tax=Coccidioides posadasii RMSCC 3488 TaxID=454284 RepID=A0A0J6ILQ2_COCPO|nr:hypothetical protein CPAG_09154 [Coccidioides posadasii RMSCC 3488]
MLTKAGNKNDSGLSSTWRSWAVSQVELSCAAPSPAAAPAPAPAAFKRALLVGEQTVQRDEYGQSNGQAGRWRARRPTIAAAALRGANSASLGSLGVVASSHTVMDSPPC